RAFHKQTAEVCHTNLAKIADTYSPIDLAYAVSQLPQSVRPVLFQNFDSIVKKIQFLINTDRSTRLAIFRYINDFETKDIIENTPPDEAVAMLDDLSEKRYRRLMDIIDKAKANRIRDIKKHGRNTAGRIMTNEFFAFLPETTVEEAVSRIRNQSGIEFTRRLFIVDPKGKLLGYVPARNLMVNANITKLSTIMLPCEQTVSPECEREEVIEKVERYKISGLPIVDEAGMLLGVVTYEDVVELIEDVADETIAAMAGTGEDISQPEPFFIRFFSRAPWLFVTLIAGLLNMCVMTLFQEYDKGFLTFVFFFVPLITGMSGNIGLQCSTVLVRHMALGTINNTNRREFVLKELMLGLFTGSAFGFFSALLVYVLNVQGLQIINCDPFVLGLIVGLGLFGASAMGTILGVFSPLLFTRIGIDPAVSSGPIITAFNDFLSMSIYFLIAVGITSLFS
ncbi:MAG: magnesium transporter, partial [Simkaniaceae bacterium]|nr:magnesium transporter [Simkaniaceae bacterium]